MTVPRFLVRPEGELPGLIVQPFGLQPGKFLGCQPPQGSVRTALVVLPPPCLDLGFCAGRRQERGSTSTRQH
jgi:hypothetical protein